MPLSSDVVIPAPTERNASAVTPQPDQQPRLWDDYVGSYEEVFEPLTNAFARRALDALRLTSGARLLDVGAGAGGAALLAAARALDVTAIDASRGMVERIRARFQGGAAPGGGLRAAVMDGTALALPDGTFDAAISVFGVIIFPDFSAGLREIARVLKSGGRAAIVTRTEVHRYELATRLAAAVALVREAASIDPPTPGPLPAQLRFREEPVFRAALEEAGFGVETIMLMEERWRAPSAHWIGERLAFAPGMATQLAELGSRREAVIARFVETLIEDQGSGVVALPAVAHAGMVVKPS